MPDHRHHGDARPGRPALTLAALCFGLYWLNVLAGRAAVSDLWQPPLLLDGVIEFCLLLVSAIGLVSAALQRERARSGSEPDAARDEHP